MNTEPDESLSEDDVALGEMVSRFLGPDIMEAVADDDVVEIYVNPDGRLWVKSHSKGRQFTGKMVGPAALHQFLNAVASSMDTTITVDQPALQAEMPLHIFRGARLQAEIPPIVAAPSFNLRKPPREIFPLESYLENETLSPAWYQAIRYAVRHHWNILVCGPTGSGKTTFCNALIREMTMQFPEERFLILEDTQELQCFALDRVEMRASGRYGLQELGTIVLRKTPDRIVVGEVRDGALVSLLRTWGTGHPGGCGTMHAETPEGALSMAELYCQWGGLPSAEVARQLIAMTVKLIVMIKPTKGGRRVTDLAQIAGLDDQGRYIIKRLPPDREAHFTEKHP